jgi:cytochrome P450
VLVLDEEPHARQRRILLPPLKGERMRSFFDAMQAATLEAVRAWPVGRPLRLLEPMQRITLHFDGVLEQQPEMDGKKAFEGT